MQQTQHKGFGQPDETGEFPQGEHLREVLTTGD